MIEVILIGKNHATFMCARCGMQVEVPTGGDLTHARERVEAGHECPGKAAKELRSTNVPDCVMAERSVDEEVGFDGAEIRLTYGEGKTQTVYIVSKPQAERLARQLFAALGMDIVTGPSMYTGGPS